MTDIDKIVHDIQWEFRTFGGGLISTDGNPNKAMENHPPVFAAGVDVQKVVEFVLKARKD